MNEPVDALLRALADDDARTETPPRVESAVMRAWRSHRQPAVGSRQLAARRQPAGQRRRLVWAALPLAAAVVIAAMVLSSHTSDPVPAVATVQPTGPVATSTRNQPEAVTPAPPVVAPQPHRRVVGRRPGNPSTRRPSDPATQQPSYLLVGAPSSNPALLSVVRLRMARSALATLGLPLPNPDAAAIVDVDVFVGEDGIARAIRPVALVSSVSQE